LTIEELERTLPNGFHDAEIGTIRLDYVKRKASMELTLWMDDLEVSPEFKELYRDAVLEFEGMQSVIFDPPDPGYTFARAEPLSVDLDERAPDPPIPAFAKLPQGSFVARFYVRDWNSWISIAATSANLRWTSEAYSRRDE
jgi:hypothetical protein